MAVSATGSVGSCMIAERLVVGRIGGVRVRRRRLTLGAASPRIPPERSRLLRHMAVLSLRCDSYFFFFFGGSVRRRFGQFKQGIAKLLRFLDCLVKSW